MFRKIRAAAYLAAFYLWTGVLAVLALPVLVLPRWAIFAIQVLWARGVFFLLRWIGGVRQEITGWERIPEGPVLFASKHQSAWDTIVFFLVRRPPPTFFFKKELLQIPIYGRFCLRSGMVPVDRAAGARAMRSVLAMAAERLKEGRSLVLFPEGTRVPVGRKARYQPGVAGIYKYLDVPVVPVALNSGLFWPKAGPTGRTGTLRMEFLDPIPPGLEKDEFLARLSDVLETATARLVAQEEQGSPPRIDTGDGAPGGL
jgi:1-acyl-sn-glycerol-3-phosphate acyltransferase